MKFVQVYPWKITYTIDFGITELTKVICAATYTQAYLEFSLKNENAMILEIERI